MVATTLFALRLKHSLSGNTVGQGQIFDDLDEDLKLKTLSAKTLVGNAEVWIIGLLYSLGAGSLIARFKVQSINSNSNLFKFLEQRSLKEHNGQL